MHDTRTPREFLGRRIDEISKLLAAKEAECHNLRAKRNAFTIAIGDLDALDADSPTPVAPIGNTKK